MKENTERDTRNSIDRLSTLSSEASGRTFEKIDKVAKTVSNYIENKAIEERETQDKEEVESRLKTSENTTKTADKTNVETTSEDDSSRIKTNVNQPENIENKNPGENSVEGEQSNKKEKVSKLKTSVSKASQKVFKFNENQGKISKVATVVSKSGEMASKTGKTIVRTSRELNKAISEDGSGRDYISDKIGRKVKSKAYKIAKKPVNKVKKKFQQTIGKKLLAITKTLLIKIMKILISVFTALAEFILPAALVIIMLVSLGSIFGSSSSESTLNQYKSYMNSIQEEYDKEVDDFLRTNPDGIVVGVKGSYGKIDWRIPLAIMQGTEAELNFEQSEKELINKFKEANLLEKHEIVEQTVIEKDGLGKEVEKTKKVLVITNGMYSDYMDWCNSNFTHISNFMIKKKVALVQTNQFTAQQLELIDMVYNSSDFTELLGDDFKTRTPSFGSTTTKANLNSEYYNSKNVLATSGFKGQCTWYSHGRALELFNLKLPSGNAQTWLSSAVAMGYETGTQPSHNSVVVLMGRKFGHVAFVEKYDGKSITISEGNVGNPCSSSNTCSQVEYANQHANELVRTKTYSSFDEYRKASKNSDLRIVGFIYLEKEKK